MSQLSPPLPRSPVQRPWRVSGVVVTIVILAAGVFLAFQLIGGSRTASAEQAPHTETFSNPIGTLSVSLDAGTLSVLAGPAGQVTITRQLTYKSQPPTYSEVWNGDVLTVNSVCPVPSNCEITYTITVPAGTAVNAQLEDGDITANGLSGRLDLSSSSGSFTLVRTSGPTTITGDAGEVKGTALNSATVDVRTSDGDVTMDFAGAPTSVRVAIQDSGDLTVTVPRETSGAAGYNIDANTRSGDRQVEVSHDPSSARSITASTAAGDLSLTYA